MSASRFVRGLLIALLCTLPATADAVVKKKQPVATKKKVARKATPKPTPPPPPPIGPAPMPNLIFGDKPVAPVNSGMSSAETLWHLRSALNVAALSCREPQYVKMGPNYNKMLRAHRTLLTRAYGGETSRYGTGAVSDSHQTKIYNFFAGPTGKAQLCWSSHGILEKIATMTSVAFDAAGPRMLAELEAPFLVTR